IVARVLPKFRQILPEYRIRFRGNLGNRVPLVYPGGRRLEARIRATARRFCNRLRQNQLSYQQLISVHGTRKFVGTPTEGNGNHNQFWSGWPKNVNWGYGDGYTSR